MSYLAFTGMISEIYDLHNLTLLEIIRDVAWRFMDNEDRISRVIGAPLREAVMND